jgi:phosphoribosylformylglycinamidine cyclo-ligase
LIAAAGLALTDPAPFAPGMSLGEALLVPTRIYVRSLLALHRAGLLKAAAHITGGGLPGNLPRVLPEGVAAEVVAASWPLPPVFPWLARAGGVAEAEMLRVFNCGLGMVVVVAADQTEAALSHLRAAGEAAFRIGQLVPANGEAEVTLQGTLGL